MSRYIPTRSFQTGCGIRFGRTELGLAGAIGAHILDDDRAPRRQLVDVDLDEVTGAGRVDGAGSAFRQGDSIAAVWRTMSASVSMPSATRWQAQELVAR